MAGEVRIRITEREGVEGGVRCPNCGGYTSFRDIVAAGLCGGGWRTGCDARLALDLVVDG
jgi:hypothetical protein